MSSCPKCGAPVDPSRPDCPRCGVVYAKASSTGADEWIAIIGGKQTPVALRLLRSWVAEGRLSRADRIKSPSGSWKTVADYSDLLMLVTTGDIPMPYEPIDAVFAFDTSDVPEGFLLGKTGDPNKAFANVKAQLRKACAALDGDAVINCEFEYRVAVGLPALVGANRVFEFFAYGTAVRFMTP